MRILQIVTLITPDGAYGGPVRVAVNQTRALLQAGHEVTLVAAASGFNGELPTLFDGIPVKLFQGYRVAPGIGFAGIFAPSFIPWLISTMKDVDVVHIHLGRDLVTLPCSVICRRLGVPYILQTHGMVMPSRHPLAPALDKLWTKSALRNAARTLYLTDAESAGLRRVDAGVFLTRLINGVPLPEEPALAQQGIDVLFLARLHPRKRPRLFVEMASRIHSAFPEVTFSIVGPDEGEASAVEALIEKYDLSDIVRWEGAVEPSDVADRISRATIYVLPSVEEPFPMTVLEAMALGKPVVVSDSCGLADYLIKSQAGVVVDSSVEALTNAVAGLLARSEHRNALGRNARKLAQELFSMEPVAAQLVSYYEEARSHRG